MTEEDRHARMVALLEANHRFPGPFQLSVVAHNREEVRLRLRAVIESEVGGSLETGAWEERPSAQGRYVSHRISLNCESAEQVVQIFAKLQAVEGVIQIL